MGHHAGPWFLGWAPDVRSGQCLGACCLINVQFVEIHLRWGFFSDEWLGATPSTCHAVSCEICATELVRGFDNICHCTCPLALWHPRVEPGVFPPRNLDTPLMYPHRMRHKAVHSLISEAASCTIRQCCWHLVNFSCFLVTLFQPQRHLGCHRSCTTIVVDN